MQPCARTTEDHDVFEFDGPGAWTWRPRGIWMTTWMLLTALLAAPPPTPATLPVPPGGSTTPAAPAPEPQFELKAPLFLDAFADTPVATVDGEPIQVKELTAILMEAHAEHGMPGKGPPSVKLDVLKLVERLVTLRVIAAEARTMGMAETPELARSFADNRAVVLRGMVKARATKGIQADPKEVDALTKLVTREVKLETVFFKAPEDVKAFVAAVKAGGSFTALAAEAVAAKKATPGDLAEYVRPDKLLPAVRGALEGVKKGELAAEPLQTAQGTAVIRLEDERYADDPDAKLQAEETSRSERKDIEFAAYLGRLRKEHAKVDRRLLAQVDFDSAKKFEARRKDERILARVDGMPPIKVSEVAEALERQFFHGVSRRADKKELNAKKQLFFDDLLNRRLADREAEVLGLKDRKEFKDRIGDFEREQLFSAFVTKVLAPDIEVKESEVKARYDANPGAYATPPMLRLEAVSYKDPKNARLALEKAQRGAEFRWLKENSDEQVAEGESNLAFDAKPLTIAGLPAGLARTLQGAHEGEYRLHVEGEQHHLVHVAAEVPAGVRPYLEVRGEVARAIYGERLDAAMREYLSKLREVHEVKIFLTKVAS
jgi:peptidyl-prolyl cis-trans isomerase C